MVVTALHPGGLSGIPYVFTVKEVAGVSIIQNPDIVQARDIILTEFKSIWDLDPSTTGVPISYQDVSFQIPESGPWLEIVLEYGQSSISSVDGGMNRLEGKVVANVHVPTGQGLFSGYELGIIALNALKGQNLRSNIWLSNARMSELGVIGTSSVLEVSVDFTYSQVQ